MLGAGERQRVLEQFSGDALGVLAVRQEPEAHLALCELGCLLHGLRDAPEGVLADNDAVHHHLDGVFELLLELDLIVELAHLAVHADAREALVPQVLEELCVLALAAQHHRGKHQRAPALGVRQDLVGHLVGGLALDDAAALRAVRGAHARVQQA